MSIVAASIFNDGVLVAGDGVCSDPEIGVVSGYVLKLDLLPDLSCVLGITGIGSFNQFLRMHLPRDITDFDGLTDQLADVVH